MENVATSNLNRYTSPHLPMRLFKFGNAERCAGAFCFPTDPDETNAITYYVDVGDWKMPFKILRASTRRKPGLLLLHGLGLHPASFRGIAGYLLPVCDLVLPDYTGFTSTDGWPEGGVSLRMLVHAIMRIPAALGLDQINIGGSSLGGGLSLMAAVDFPGFIDRIVLFNPAVFPQPLPSFYRLVRVPIVGPLFMFLISSKDMARGVSTIGYVDSSRLDKELMQIYEDNMKPSVNRRRLLDLIRYLPQCDTDIQHFLSYAGKLPQEVLTIWGEQDKLLAAGVAERLRQTLPHNQFHNFPDLSHLPHEESPDRIGPIVAKFLAETRPPYQGPAVT
ncbi:MAG: alpha/beta hydrolase [Phycisphaerae bacterium]